MLKNIKAQITDELHTRAKVRAAQEGITLIELLTKALEVYVQPNKIESSSGSQEKPRPVQARRAPSVPVAAPDESVTASMSKKDRELLGV
jgi:hypothetical protein